MLAFKIMMFFYAERKGDKGERGGGVFVAVIMGKGETWHLRSHGYSDVGPNGYPLRNREPIKRAKRVCKIFSRTMIIG